MKQERLVAITICDLCNSEVVNFWKCGVCQKDACGSCCTEFSITTRQPTHSVLAVITTLPVGKSFGLVALVCSKCKPQMEDAFQKLGFGYEPIIDFIAA